MYAPLPGLFFKLPVHACQGFTTHVFPHHDHVGVHLLTYLPQLVHKDFISAVGTVSHYHVLVEPSHVIICLAAVAGVYFLAGAETTVRIYTLVVHAPLLLLLLAISRYRGWRLVFQLLSAILFWTLVHHGAGLLYYLSGGYFWVLILSYLVLSAGVIWFLIRFLRPLFLQVLLELDRGWWLMCLVMATYYVIIIYLIPGFVGLEENSTIIKSAISFLMVGFYSILMFLFSSIRKEAETRHSAQLSALQLSALQSRMEAVKAAEDAIRTERHDLRHRLQTVTELVSRGDREATLEFLDTARKRLDERKEIRWCRPPVLDAVFSSYFDQAKQQDIRVEAEISLPEKLPVDEGELAIVFANALENAIHANMELPIEQRRLRCRGIGYPNIMAEIVNPFLGAVEFDKDGYPISAKEGHGLGTQSIRFFCEKYGAVCQYEAENGLFSFRVIL